MEFDLILIFFTIPVFFYRPLNLANRIMHISGLCHQPISCHGLSAVTEDVLNWTLCLDIIRGTTIRKAKFCASRSLLIHVHPCSRFILSKMAVMHKGNRLYKTRN